MAFVPVARGVSVVIQGNRGADKRINVLHVDNRAGNPMSVAVPEIAGIVGAWVTTSYRSSVTDRIGFDRVTARDISVVDGTEYVFDSGNQAGLQTDDPLPGNVCALLSLHTAQGGRRGRGRVFHFEGTESDLTDSRFTNVYVAAIVTSFNTLDAALSAAGYELCVYSRKGNALYDVTSITGSQDIATQRDRLPGRRAHRRPRANPT